jgi:hypothetical protein
MQYMKDRSVGGTNLVFVACQALANDLTFQGDSLIRVHVLKVLGKASLPLLVHEQDVLDHGCAIKGTEKKFALNHGRHHICEPSIAVIVLSDMSRCIPEACHHTVW